MKRRSVGEKIASIRRAARLASSIMFSAIAFELFDLVRTPEAPREPDTEAPEWCATCLCAVDSDGRCAAWCPAMEHLQ